MPDTPAQELRAAAARLRSGIPTARADLDPLLANWLDAEADRLDATAHPGWQTHLAPHAHAIAQAINQETT